MQQAIPYNTHEEYSTEENISKRVKGMVQENAVVVFGKRGCCMCQVMKYLLLLFGVNPVVCEVKEGDVIGVVNELVTIGKGKGNKFSRPEFPCHIGGKLLGDMDKLMAAHISGELTPTLKEAGALLL